MARETDELLGHESDGIQEYDNPLPRWWLMLFYGSIIWAIGYMFYYHVGSDWSSAGKYEAEVAAAAEKYGDPQAPAVIPEGQSLAATLADPQRVERGKTLWNTYCASCHKPDGTGLIGPNMTDATWLHGWQPENLVQTINIGVLSKGMVAWGPQLGPEKVLDAAAFVSSLGGTAAAGAAGAEPGVDPAADHTGHEECAKDLGAAAAPKAAPESPPE